jgi:hypothetical protein
VGAKSGLQRSGSKEGVAKNITDITDPTPSPPLEGRGWLRIELRGGQGVAFFPKLFFLFLLVFIGFFSGRFAVPSHTNSDVTMSHSSAQHEK